MEFRYSTSIWILWTNLAFMTAPDIIQTPTPPALSFVLSLTGVYELEDTPALIWRNNDPTLTNQAFYFLRMMFACSEASSKLRGIERKSLTKSLAFISQVMEPQTIQSFETHPQFCQHKKKYHPSAVPINNPKMQVNGQRQEFSIGYEIHDDCKKLKKEGLPPMERFEGMAEDSGWLETFRVIYDTENLIARQASYELDFFGLSETAPGSCELFEVAKSQEFFNDISFKKAYKRSAQIGDAGSLTVLVRPRRPESQSVKRANGSRSPSGSPQSESKKARVIVEPEGPQPSDDESSENEEVPLINNRYARWDSDEYFCLRPLKDFNPSITTTPSTKTEGESSTSTKSSVPAPLALYNYDPSEEEYLVMQQLAPIEYFDVFTVQWSTCTHLNVIPMWISLANGPWIRVNQAIRKMLYVIDKLSVVAGTYGVLKLRKQGTSSQYLNAYLRSNDRNIAVPELFYKFVVHKVPIPAQPAASWSFGIIIVMRNDLGVPTKRICPKDPDNLCYRYGWNVGSEDDEIARPYCCRPTSATLKLLDITSYSSPINDLDLNSVVVEINDAGQRVVRNYNQFLYTEYKVVAKKRAKTKKLNDSYT